MEKEPVPIKYIATGSFRMLSINKYVNRYLAKVYGFGISCRFEDINGILTLEYRRGIVDA